MVDLAEIGASLPVLFVATLNLFSETLAHVERVRARYGLDLRVCRSEPDLDGIEADAVGAGHLEPYQRITRVEHLAAGSGLGLTTDVGRSVRDSIARRASREYPAGAATAGSFLTATSCHASLLHPPLWRPCVRRRAHGRRRRRYLEAGTAEGAAATKQVLPGGVQRQRVRVGRDQVPPTRGHLSSGRVAGIIHGHARTIRQEEAHEIERRSDCACGPGNIRL